MKITPFVIRPATVLAFLAPFFFCMFAQLYSSSPDSGLNFLEPTFRQRSSPGAKTFSVASNILVMVVAAFLHRSNFPAWQHFKAKNFCLIQ